MPVIREAWRMVRDVQNPAPAAAPAPLDPPTAQAAPGDGSTADDGLVSRMQSLLASLGSTPAAPPSDGSRLTMGEIIRSLQAYNAQLTDAEVPGRTASDAAKLAIYS